MIKVSLQGNRYPVDFYCDRCGGVMRDLDGGILMWDRHIKDPQPVIMVHKACQIESDRKLSWTPLYHAVLDWDLLITDQQRESWRDLKEL